MSRARRCSRYRLNPGVGAGLLRPEASSEAAAVTRVQLAGTLNDVQGVAGSEVFHLVWETVAQSVEQMELRQLVRRRVVVTVELSPLDPGAGQP